MGFWDFIFSGNSNSNRSPSSFFNSGDSADNGHSSFDTNGEEFSQENSEYHECDQDDPFSLL